MFYSVDPLGDAIITILNYCILKWKIFAWDESAEPASALHRASTRRSAKDPKSRTSSHPVFDPNGNESGGSDILDDDLGKESSFAGNTPATSIYGSECEDSVKEPGKDKPTNIPEPMKVRVSSLQLALASRRLEKILIRQEGTMENDDQGLQFVGCVQNCDPEVFVIFMKIIHGRTRFVPRMVTLEFLTQIALLIDYFNCHEFFEVWFEGFWRPNLPNPVPATYGRDLICRLFISCVFREAGVFKDLTRIIINEARGPFQTLGLPFNQCFVGGLMLIFFSENVPYDRAILIHHSHP